MRRCVGCTLALLASLPAAAGRACSLWQVINDVNSRFTDVSGVLNDKYSLELKGAWAPTISGKMMQTFDGACPSSISELEGVGFTLSTSASEPLLVSYSEVKAGPATIGVSQLTAILEPTHFVASAANCVGPLSGGSWCFSGSVVMRAVAGNAHVLSHDFDLADQTGEFHVWGYVEPDENELTLELVKIEARVEIDTKDVHGPFQLGGYLRSAAQLPYAFSFEGARTRAAAERSRRPALCGKAHAPFAPPAPPSVGTCRPACRGGERPDRRRARRDRTRPLRVRPGCVRRGSRRP
jgi:hypothetical protein